MQNGIWFLFWPFVNIFNIDIAEKMHSNDWDFQPKEERVFPHPGLWLLPSCPDAQLPSSSIDLQGPAGHCSLAAELLLSAQGTARYWNHFGTAFHLAIDVSRLHLHCVTVQKKKRVNARKKNVTTFLMKAPCPMALSRSFRIFFCVQS